MKNSWACVEAELAKLRQHILADFSALSWVGRNEKLLRWKIVSGNSNERFKQIAQKPGKGLAGIVIRHGRPFIVDGRMPGIERVRLEYPIMIAEHLLSAAAVPVWISAEEKGVLLAGMRSVHLYQDQELNELKHAADRIEHYLQERDTGFR